MFSLRRNVEGVLRMSATLPCRSTRENYRYRSCSLTFEHWATTAGNGVSASVDAGSDG